MLKIATCARELRAGPLLPRKGTGRLWSVKINTRFSCESNLLSDAVKAPMSITRHPTRDEIYVDKFQPRFDNRWFISAGCSPGTCCCNNGLHAAASILPYTRADGWIYGDTRSWQLACTSASGVRKCAVHGPKHAADRRIEGMTEGRQRRDISTMELCQCPCALKSYVLILLNLAHTCSIVVLIHLRDYFAMLVRTFEIPR